jgi:hypothetical protein
MNVLKMYAVYDVKAQMYSHPHFLQSDGVAIRSFSQVCEDENSQFNKYPSDFSLYFIGSFDVESGEVIPDVPRQICNASEFVKLKSAEEISKFAKEAQALIEDSE